MPETQRSQMVSYKILTIAIAIIIDGMDAKKSVNTSENLSVKSNGQLLAVERKQTMIANDTTFLNFTGMKAQAYPFRDNSVKFIRQPHAGIYNRQIP